MNYLLSTEALKEVVELADPPNPFTQWRLNQQPPDEALYVSVISIGLLETVLLRIPSADPAKKEAFQHHLRQTMSVVFRNRILPIDERTARLWGRLRDIRDENDSLISSDVTLVLTTAVVNDLLYIGRRMPWMMTYFQPIGLTIIDPWGHDKPPQSA